LEGVVGWEGKEEQGAEFEGTRVLIVDLLLYIVVIYNHD
jgi:hypothetical protein